MDSTEENMKEIAKSIQAYLERKRTNRPSLNDYGYSFMKPMGQSIVNDNHKDADGGPLLQGEQT